MLFRSEDVVVIETSTSGMKFHTRKETFTSPIKGAGTRLSQSDSVSWCARVTSDGRDYNVTKVTLKGSLLILEFSHTGITVDLE